MRFQSTFTPYPQVKPSRKSVVSRPPVRGKSSNPMDKVLEACTQLALMSGEPPVLREYVAETARKVFTGAVAGILVRQGSSCALEAVSSASKESPEKAV